MSKNGNKTYAGTIGNSGAKQIPALFPAEKAKGKAIVKTGIKK